VYREFEAIAERGGVLGAMRPLPAGKIQEESLYYEQQKHDARCRSSASTPSCRRTAPRSRGAGADPLDRCEKDAQVRQCTRSRRGTPTRQARRSRVAGGRGRGENVFAELMQTVRVASLGQISHALYQVGGQYRRNM